MWFDRLTAGLRRLYGGDLDRARSEQAPPDALEQALLAQHAALYPDRRPVRGWIGAHRWAVAGVATALVTAVACQVPVDYERAFGASVSCALSAEMWDELRLEALSTELAADLGAHQVAIRVHDENGEKRQFRVDLWGAEGVEDAALMASMQVHAPFIPAGACSQAPLAGTVHGTLGGRLGYSLLDLELDGADAEQARLEILEALTREGLAGDAEVEIWDRGDGKREVKIRIEAHHPGELQGEEALELEELHGAPGEARP